MRHDGTKTCSTVKMLRHLYISLMWTAEPFPLFHLKALSSVELILNEKAGISDFSHPKVLQLPLEAADRIPKCNAGIEPFLSI